ncbi:INDETERMINATE(ID)-DOMAIN 15, SHOOT GRAVITROPISM 5, ARABIDOPSIS THALIANA INDETERMINATE(ID)-DOMAIN 15 [Hibiscus trionum]|uniref:INDETERMINATE(ID)-DOMAIN 15, SHOOT GRAVITROPISM 5, ARABIDOPSIS THALIANA INDETERMINATE(ID)-DOMAIN 15 n=1 Tax=Hibiscus trionum TaxID=183268 RepID=A0A9W7J2J6_HIBTR|nr:INDETERMINATE(ID)-DOMAIN 15, SHOOT GRAVITROPISM 5, ARABIDOPSIS THALIANA INDETERMINATE(ID)-DOMAIN 15 [Hibiscus trionum]
MSSEPFSCFENGNHNNKRKRRPAGTPDPDAEVVSLSPKTLLESDRYVCEICNQGFQRDQNLQMHRRRHKVPWKLLKRETPVVRKRVFVCPEPSCLHHDPCHALGDLVGIKKHFRRKHSNHRQWVCQKCSKGYAVQSDYKAHLKTCGTRGHSCDCGRVFSRVESFIEHQDVCHIRSESQEVQPACLSRTASSPSPSSETMFLSPRKDTNSSKNGRYHNLELQLLTTSREPYVPRTSTYDKHSTRLQLSIGTADVDDKTEPTLTCTNMETDAHEQLKLAMAEKAYAEEARQQAKRLIEFAEQEFAKAKRLRQLAQVELEKAQALKDDATKQINNTILQITCHACKQQLQETSTTPEDNSLVVSYISSAITGTG